MAEELQKISLSCFCSYTIILLYITAQVEKNKIPVYSYTIIICYSTSRRDSKDKLVSTFMW